MNYPENCSNCKFKTMEWYQVHKKKMPTCNVKLPQTITKNTNVCCSYIPDVKIFRGHEIKYK
jgi:hypothetical protein